MTHPIRRTSAACVLALLCFSGRASAQGFDLTAVDLPPGFLDMTDVVVTTGSRGDIIATGNATLGNAGAFVLLSVDPELGVREGLTVGIKPQAWSLTENVPVLSGPVLDGIDFSNVGLVLASGEREAYSGELSYQEWLFYREIYQSDEFDLTLQPGLNLIAAIPAAELGPDHPLIPVMEALGIEKGVILLQGTLGRSLAMIGGKGGGGNPLEDLFLRAELPPMRPPGSPAWFLGGQLALELTGDPSVRLVGEMNIAIGEDELMFFVAASIARTGMALTGGMIGDEDGWQQPFGIPWLVLNGVVLQIAITPTGTIQPGFAADLVIGEKDIDVAIAVALRVSPYGVPIPTNVMFSGESETGVAFSDLVELQSDMAAARQAASGALGVPVGGPPRIPLDALPDIALRSMELGFATRDAPELGIERGFRIAGRLWLPLSADGELVDFAGVDVGVSEEGIWARGDLGEFGIGPLIWHDAMLDLTATREVQHLIVKGGVELFGSMQLVDLMMSKDSLSFRTVTRVQNMFSADISATGAFNLRSPDFQVDAVASADFGQLVGPLVQDAMVLFVQSSAAAIGAAADATRKVDSALSRADAKADELRIVLEAVRGEALAARDLAQRDASAALRSMRSTYSARNRALRSYRRTSYWPAWRKAQALNSYRRAHTRYLRSAVQYNRAAAVLTVRERVLSAIPPVGENIMLMSAEAAVAELRARLRTARQELEAMEAEVTAISDALDGGEQLMVIERAEFHGGLQSAINGEGIRWDILGSFVGEPFEIHRTLSFNNPAEGAAQMIQSLMGG